MSRADDTTLNKAEPQRTSVTGPDAVLLAWITAAVTNAITITRSLAMPPRLVTRVLHHSFDAGHFLALGLAWAGLVGLHVRFGRARPRASAALLVALSLAFGALLLPGDLRNAAERLASGKAWVKPALLVTFVALFSLAVPVAVLLGRLAARPFLRWIAIASGMAVLSVNPVLLEGDYASARLFVASAAVALVAAALAGAVLPARLASLASRLRPLRVPLLAVASLAAATSLVVPPRPSVVVALLSPSGSLLPPFLSALQENMLPEDAPVPPEMAPWFVDRKNAPPVPPGSPPVLPPHPAVILLSIDCLRNDFLASGKYDDQLPTLAALRTQGVYFQNARSAGSQTVYSLASLFAGTYYSQQYWTEVTAPHAHGLWPEKDESTRFPELLRAGGVSTITFAATPWLVNRFGIVRGFSEETYLRPGKHHWHMGKPLVDAALARLGQVRDEPFFLYIHLLDAHAPYDLAGTSGTAFERHLRELILVDGHVRRLLDAIERSPFAARAAVVLTSDHGEAFGEHGHWTHANSLYDELLRVPLIVRARNVAPRVVDEPVTLVDLGPTILDLFGAETPGTFMGQSLVPFLRGESPRLTRPIVAETRLKRALVLRDATKLIVDDRNRTVELYDLAADPSETNSLADDPVRLMPPLALMRRLLATHTLRREGYVTPYRR
ncbi:sulfatase [Polyangium jinanense]|uniref:sulfatase n=1 Tax=Polyangium jinanense TaxID=2829994 RepID=UPI002341DCD8|nr:sulfatase [Polyangium jinanense]MDC3958604.1 sulfatase [Polyangium jinanense]